MILLKPLPDSFNNKRSYNTDFPLPSLTQTKHPAEHSAPQHGQTQQDVNNSGDAWNTGIQLRDLPSAPQDKGCIQHEEIRWTTSST